MSAVKRHLYDQFRLPTWSARPPRRPDHVPTSRPTSNAADGRSTCSGCNPTPVCSNSATAPASESKPPLRQHPGTRRRHRPLLHDARDGVQAEPDGDSKRPRHIACRRRPGPTNRSRRVRCDLLLQRLVVLERPRHHDRTPHRPARADGTARDHPPPTPRQPNPRRHRPSGATNRTADAPGRTRPNPSGLPAARPGTSGLCHRTRQLK